MAALTREKLQLYIMYGSQTGNAQSIAEDLEATIQSKLDSSGDGLSFDIQLAALPMNNWKKAMEPNPFDKDKTAKANTMIVFICSTTGNGDPPDNCDKFWRFLRRRTNPDDLLKEVLFTVLGLGDTNYDKFCHMGISLNKRLAELGGKRFYDLACADEGTGNMEETIEPWTAGLWEAIEKQCARLLETDGCDAGEPVEATSPGGDAAAISPEPEAASDPVWSLASQQDRSPSAAKLALPHLTEIHPCPPHVPGEGAAAGVSPRSLAQQEKESSSHILVTLTGLPLPERLTDPASLFSCMARCSLTFDTASTRVRAQPLCSLLSQEEVIHMEVTLSGSGMKYEPGDAIGIKCPNRDSDIEFILSRLQLAMPEGRDADTLFTHTCPHLPEPSSCREALTYHLDITTPPRKPMLRSLAECCKEKSEKQQLLYLATRKMGNKEYASFVADQGLTIAEILAAFPSCRPSPAELLAVLPPLSPRMYSVACSQLACPEALSVAFSVVNYQLDDNHHSHDLSCHLSLNLQRLLCPLLLFTFLLFGRSGLCTSWLEQQLGPWLSGEGPSSTSTAVELPIYLRRTKEFYLPGSTKWPCILVGPGTGVAPFIGFLQHRQSQAAHMEEQKDAVCSGVWRGDYEVVLEGEESVMDGWKAGEGRGDVLLFFGCQHKEHDWLYRKEMETYLSNGTLTKLFTAFSRDQADKVYVQHELEKHGQEIADLLLKEGAYVYVCGDGNSMAQGVRAALARVLSKHGEITADKAEAVLADLKQRRRFVMDVWS
ncbi:unnamed protein product [Chrysoparadoxa australica]